MRTVRCRLLVVSCLVTFAVPATANDATLLFAEHATLAVSIVAPIEQVADQRDSGEYYDGKLRYTDTAGQEQEVDIKLRARGRYRRQLDTCRFPPVRLNFRKKQLEGTIFEGQDKLKLVTHCQNRGTLYEQLLLKEYLTYRMWQEMTDYSFRVRLLRIDWIDSDNPTEPLQRYGFLLEDEELLGERIGLELSNVRSASPANMPADQAALLAVFEYIIANTDFSMILGPAEEVCCHNVVLYDAPQGHLPIPYDFDFAGFVNAPYAKPNPKLRLRSVTTRMYRGRCEHNDSLDSAIEKFQAKRAALFALIDNQPGLSDRTRNSARRFIEKSYKVIDDPKQVDKWLARKCV